MEAAYCYGPALVFADDDGDQRKPEEAHQKPGRL